MRTLQANTSACIKAFTILFMTSQQANAASYQEVYDVVFKQPKPSNKKEIQAEQALYASGKLPAYKVTAGKFTKSVTQQLAKRTKKTLVDTVDYYDRLEKLVHSNGICMAGTWYITKTAQNKDNQSYTGMFAQGASSLFIGRLSVALSDTKQGESQAFSMAGKIFGTNDLNKDVTTESFFVGDVLSGVERDSVFSAPMTTKPKVGVRFGILRLGFKLGGLFSDADKDPGMRPVTGIARMGVHKNVVSPKYMMVQPINPKGYTMTKGIDFRDEFQLSASEIKNKTPRYFAVSVSDTASNPEDKGWQHVGFIRATETTVSYGCDRQLHFAHPKSGS